MFWLPAVLVRARVLALEFKPSFLVSMISKMFTFFCWPMGMTEEGSGPIALKSSLPGREFLKVWVGIERSSTLFSL